MKIDIYSSDPNFSDFKDELKARLSSAYFGVNFESEDFCGAKIKDVFNASDIAILCDDIFGQSEDAFIDLLGEVYFKGDGYCPVCGTNCLSIAGEKDYRSLPDREPREYICIQEHKFEIK
jgi:hypothetical protein